MIKTHGVLFRDNRFLRIRADELLFDLALFFYVKGFLYSIVSRGKMLYQAMSFNWLVFIGPFIAFFITWYTGLLAIRLSYLIKNKRLSNIPIVLFIWIPASMLIYIDQNLMGISGRTMAQIHGFWNYFGVLVGIIAGVLFGYTEKYVEEGKSVLVQRLEGMMSPSALFFFYLGFYTAFRINFPPHIFFALAIVIPFGLVKLTNMLDDDKEHPVGFYYLVFRTYIFPFIIIGMLCLWQELFIFGKINTALMEHTALTIPEMLGYLFITGIIPVRIIMALQPPATLLGIITGLSSMSYFFYSIVLLMRSIFW